MRGSFVRISLSDFYLNVSFSIESEISEFKTSKRIAFAKRYFCRLRSMCPLYCCLGAAVSKLNREHRLYLPVALVSLWFCWSIRAVTQFHPVPPRDFQVTFLCRPSLKAMVTTGHLFIFGLGFTGQRLAAHLQQQGWKVSGTVRSEEKREELVKAFPEMNVYLFGQTILEPLTAAAPNNEEAGYFKMLDTVTHVVDTAPVNKESGRDPVLETLESVLKMKGLKGEIKWAGYLSTTGVYGDAKGGEVDEDTVCQRMKIGS